MLSGVRVEAGVWGDMGLADDGYIEEDEEEGPGPTSTEWEGGADGGSINPLLRGFAEPGFCCWRYRNNHFIYTDIIEHGRRRTSIQLVLGVMGSGSGEGRTRLLPGPKATLWGTP